MFVLIATGVSYPVLKNFLWS